MTLYVTSRGLTTSAIPYGSRHFQVDFDFIDHRLRVTDTDGSAFTMALEPKSVARFYGEFMAGLRGLDIDVRIWTRPVEVAEAIPFEADETHASYDRGQVQLLWRGLLQADRVIKEFQTGYAGKASPVHFFWGGFDLAAARFSGRPAPLHPGGAPNCAPWVMEEAYSRGLLAREGPSTPYELEQHVRATLGNFWSFAHTLLYTEPPRLAALGLLTETRETEGRRRRVFSITDAGASALSAWLDRPSGASTELRDLGLLQLFFTDLASSEARLRLAEQQLAIHQAKLLAYQEDERLERRLSGNRKGQRTIEHWRGETLRMGVLYEGVAVDFWTEIVAKARAEQSASPDASRPAAKSRP